MYIVKARQKNNKKKIVENPNLFFLLHVNFWKMYLIAVLI